MEICYIEAGVLERMLARAENLSARVDRLYELLFTDDHFRQFT